MDEYLVISVLGTDKPGIINQLASVVLDNECNILDTRMTVLGEEFALIMMISGKDHSIAALEQSICKSTNASGLTIITRRTTEKEPQLQANPYAVTVIALDNPGIVHEIAGFFSERKINIEDMHTSTYAAAHTGSPMFSLVMAVNVPTSVRTSQLKEAFITFCDDRNLDATMEAGK